MRTESKNLDWTGILSVVETQRYERELPNRLESDGTKEDVKDGMWKGTTSVRTQVMFRSRLGDRLRAMRKDERDGGAGEEEKKGWLATWSTKGVQRSIEAIASRKTENQLGKSKEGMTIVLERLRSGGLGCVLDGMRRDRELAFGGEGGVFKG